MKLWLRGNPFYGFDLQPDADNAAVGKYAESIAAGVLPAALFFRSVTAIRRIAILK